MSWKQDGITNTLWSFSRYITIICNSSYAHLGVMLEFMRAAFCSLDEYRSQSPAEERRSVRLHPSPHPPCKDETDQPGGLSFPKTPMVAGLSQKNMLWSSVIFCAVTRELHLWHGHYTCEPETGQETSVKTLEFQTSRPRKKSKLESWLSHYTGETLFTWQRTQQRWGLVLGGRTF